MLLPGFNYENEVHGNAHSTFRYIIPFIVSIQGVSTMYICVLLKYFNFQYPEGKGLFTDATNVKKLESEI